MDELTLEVRANTDAINEIIISGAITATFDFDNASLRDLLINPIEVVAAPGVNKTVVLDSFAMVLLYGSDVFTTTPSTVFAYNAGAALISSYANSTFWASSQDVFVNRDSLNSPASGVLNVASSSNRSVLFSLIGSLSGNPSNDTEFRLIVNYRIIDI